MLDRLTEDIPGSSMGIRLTAIQPKTSCSLAQGLSQEAVYRVPESHGTLVALSKVGTPLSIITITSLTT
jgi:hypothetical protein